MKSISKFLMVVVVLSAPAVQADLPNKSERNPINEIQSDINSKVQASKGRIGKAQAQLDADKAFNKKYEPVAKRLQEIVNVLQGPGQSLTGTREQRTAANKRIADSATKALDELLRLEGMDPETRKKLEEMKRDPKIRSLTDLKEIVRAVADSFKSKDFSKRHAEPVVKKANEIMGVIASLEKQGIDPMRSNLPSVKSGKATFKPKDLAKSQASFDSIARSARNAIDTQERRRSELNHLRINRKFCPSPDFLFKRQEQLRAQKNHVGGALKKTETEVASYTDKARAEAVAKIISEVDKPSVPFKKLVDHYEQVKAAKIKMREDILSGLKTEKTRVSLLPTKMPKAGVDYKEVVKGPFKVRVGNTEKELDDKGIKEEMLEAVASDLIEGASPKGSLKDFGRTQELIRNLKKVGVDAIVDMPKLENDPMTKKEHALVSLIKEAQKNHKQWGLLQDGGVSNASGYMLMANLMGLSRKVVKTHGTKRGAEISKRTEAYDKKVESAKQQLAKLRNQKTSLDTEHGHYQACLNASLPIRDNFRNLKKDASAKDIHSVSESYRRLGEDAAKRGIRNQVRTTRDEVRDSIGRGAKRFFDWQKNVLPGKVEKWKRDAEAYRERKRLEAEAEKKYREDQRKFKTEMGTIEKSRFGLGSRPRGWIK